MSATIDLRPDAVLLDHPAATLADVLGAASAKLASQSGAEPSVIRSALAATCAESSFGVGAGIAVPHAAIPELPRHAIALVRVAEPLDVGAIDGTPVDLLFVVIHSSSDPSGHLKFLAHLAGMCRSRVFRDGLRGASSASEVIDLIAAAEARSHGARTSPAPAHERALAIIAVSGERAADNILVGMLSEELESATIVDAQTLQDAASREVPLFAGFRDLFGDPGGRRVIFANLDSDRADTLAAIVQRACEDEQHATAELIIVPVANRWEWRAAPAPARRGH